METYTRNIKTKLTLLRVSFVLALAACIYLFQFKHIDYSIVLLFLLVCGSIIPLSNLTITSDKFIVRVYYVYGLVSQTQTFHRGDNIEIFHFDLELSDTSYRLTDEWWDLFAVLLLPSNAAVRKFIIKHTDIIGNRTRINLRLTEMERELIERHITKTGNAHNSSLQQ